MGIHRDWYGYNPWLKKEGNEFDLGSGLASGPFGSPNRVSPS
jgi:hypothetical protein